MEELKELAGKTIDSGVARAISIETLKSLGLVHLTINSHLGHDNILDSVDAAMERIVKEVKTFGKWLYLEGKRFRLDVNSPASIEKAKQALVEHPRARLTGSLRGGAKKAATKPTKAPKAPKAPKAEKPAKTSKPKAAKAPKGELAPKASSVKVISKKKAVKVMKGKTSPHAGSEELLSFVAPMGGGRPATDCVSSDELPSAVGEDEIVVAVVTVRRSTFEKSKGDAEVCHRHNPQLAALYLPEVCRGIADLVDRYKK